jgi:hypothetical protein
MNRLLRIASMLAFAVLLVSGAVAMPGWAQTIVNDNDPSVIYSLSTDTTTPTSDWSYYSGILRDYDGNEHSSNFSRPGTAYQGASVSITFTGTTITWYGKKGPRYGYAIAGLETGAFVQFNGYNAIEIDQNANVTLSAPYGYHVLTIKLLHQTQGSDYYQRSITSQSRAADPLLCRRVMSPDIHSGTLALSLSIVWRAGARIPTRRTGIATGILRPIYPVGISGMATRTTPSLTDSPAASLKYMVGLMPRMDILR